MSLIKTVVLAEATARVPWPGVPGRLLPTEPFDVSVIDPFFSALLADGTILAAPVPAAPSPDSAEKKPKA